MLLNNFISQKLQFARIFFVHSHYAIEDTKKDASGNG